MLESKFMKCVIERPDLNPFQPIISFQPPTPNHFFVTVNTM